MDVDLDTVHVRESGMTAPELLMSESQERMMAFVSPSNVDEVLEIASKWEIDSAVVGKVQSGSTLTIRHKGEVVAQIPAASLADDAPLYDRPASKPDWIDSLWATPTEIPNDDSPGDILLRLLDDPGIGSAAWIHEQYDHMLFLNTVVGPGSDGSLLRIKGTEKALAVSTDGNGRLCYLDPKRGSARLVYEAALNVAVTGARPTAVVDNLNFGNPEKPEVMWQFTETVEGISEACEALAIPVVGGNVSFYNETEGTDIHPTPIVGMLGLADPAPKEPPRLSHAREGMEIWEVGPESGTNMAGSAVQRVVSGDLVGRPTSPDAHSATRSIGLATDLAHRVPVLHDISDGGMAVAIAEISLASRVGAQIHFSDVYTLFAEDPHRFLVVMEPGAVELPEDFSRQVGVVTGENIRFGNEGPVPLAQARSAFEQAIPSRMSA
jgi:phosphoribosylformylglycinamidine synthase